MLDATRRGSSVPVFELSVKWFERAFDPQCNHLSAVTVRLILSVLSAPKGLAHKMALKKRQGRCNAPVMRFSLLSENRFFESLRPFKTKAFKGNNKSVS